jgi:hypothetical protein
MTNEKEFSHELALLTSFISVFNSFAFSIVAAYRLRITSQRGGARPDIHGFANNFINAVVTVFFHNRSWTRIQLACR